MRNIFDKMAKPHNLWVLAININPVIFIKAAIL